WGPGRSRNDGSSGSASTSPGLTTCATSNSRTSGSSCSGTSAGVYATTQCVVPRSMPTMYRISMVYFGFLILDSGLEKAGGMARRCARRFPSPNPKSAIQNRSDFHLGRGEDHLVLLAGHEGGQVDAADAPAPMLERALERRIADDVAGEADG